MFKMKKFYRKETDIYQHYPECSVVGWVTSFLQSTLLGINVGLTIEPLAQATVTSSQALWSRVKWVIPKGVRGTLFQVCYRVYTTNHSPNHQPRLYTKPLKQWLWRFHFELIDPDLLINAAQYLTRLENR